VRHAVVREYVLHVSRLLEILVPSDVQAPASLDLGDGEALLDFSWMARGVQGYVWSFPTPVRRRPMRTQGIFDSRVQAQAPRVALKATLQEAVARLDVVLDHHAVKGHPLRWMHPAAVLSAPRVLLVGDAAGTDPLLGEGISFALGYGDVAARGLRDAFANGDFSFQDYRARVLDHRSAISCDDAWLWPGWSTASTVAGCCASCGETSAPSWVGWPSTIWSTGATRLNRTVREVGGF
jgi:hypothetical protein